MSLCCKENRDKFVGLPVVSCKGYLARGYFDIAKVPWREQSLCKNLSKFHHKKFNKNVVSKAQESFKLHHTNAK
jgi:hypothetical protein